MFCKGLNLDADQITSESQTIKSTVTILYVYLNKIQTNDLVSVTY